MWCYITPFGEFHILIPGYPPLITLLKIAGVNVNKHFLWNTQGCNKTPHFLQSNCIITTGMEDDEIHTSTKGQV